jgi:SAM-dependent methyltransferase
MGGVAGFYDQLAPYYHLIFADWDASIARQAEQLDGLIRSRVGAEARDLLDVSCGIGTQALGLAARGYRVVASDLSPGQIERARREASARGLAIAWSVADLAGAFDHHQREFPVVLSADNSLPHLLDDAAILGALRQLKRCTAAGGACILTLRDYAREDRSPVQVRPYGLRRDGDRTFLLLQTWEFDGDRYDLTLYCIEHGEGRRVALASRTRYYAIPVERVAGLMREAGFARVERIDDAFYQPVLIGYRERGPTAST